MTVCLALDTPDPAVARGWMETYGPVVGAFKAGPVLFHSWPGVVDAAHDAGKPLFLDLKFHDIPNTVALAVGALAGRGVDWVTCHLAGGREMLAAAVEAGGGATRVIGVGVLTSLADDDWGAFAGTGVAEAQAALVRIGLEAGLEDFVAPAADVAPVRRAAPAGTLWVPGVRFAGQAAQDQVRVATPESALAAGADWLVMGRAVTGVEPAEAARLLSTLSVR